MFSSHFLIFFCLYSLVFPLPLLYLSRFLFPPLLSLFPPVLSLFTSLLPSSILSFSSFSFQQNFLLLFFPPSGSSSLSGFTSSLLFPFLRSYSFISTHFTASSSSSSSLSPFFFQIFLSLPSSGWLSGFTFSLIFPLFRDRQPCPWPPGCLSLSSAHGSLRTRHGGQIMKEICGFPQ